MSFLNRAVSPAIVLSVLAVALTGGCAYKSADNVTIENGQTLDAGVLAVDVENVRGSVEVWAQPALKAPTVEAIRLDGAPGDKPYTFVASQLVGSEHGAILRVVSADRADAAAPPMLLRVRVPACDGLRIRTNGGTVLASNVGGAITIDTSGKDVTTTGVRVTANRPIAEPVRIHCASGDVHVTIPTLSEVAVNLDASGNSKLMTSSTRVKVTKVTMKRIEASVGSGTAPMEIRAERGNVRVLVED
ncbi:MAG: hypothetical protein GIKADHBN_01839 [Phycisphaerales bacterium]|nr:hypothetical protein [Phycisphaerales bacterium]